MALRKIIDDDHHWLVELHNDPEVLRNLTCPTRITLGSHMAWWRRTSKDPREKRLIFTVNGVRVGITKFYRIDFANLSCVLGADIHKDHRGNGFMRPMWKLMLSVCFDELNLHRVSLTTAEFNHIAHRTYLDMGFREEGRMVQSLFRDGRYYDEVLLYMLNPRSSVLDLNQPPPPCQNGALPTELTDDDEHPR